MCVLYFIVWLLGFIIYIYATSTLVPSGCKSLDDTKDVVLSCSLCQFFFCNCAAQWVYTTGDISNVFEQNSWFLNFFLKKLQKRSHIFLHWLHSFRPLCYTSVGTYYWTRDHLVLVSSTILFTPMSIILQNKSFKIINKIDIFLP